MVLWFTRHQLVDDRISADQVAAQVTGTDESLTLHLSAADATKTWHQVTNHIVHLVSVAAKMHIIYDLSYHGHDGQQPKWIVFCLWSVWF